MGPLLKDAQWVRQAFLVRKEDLAVVDQQNRTFTSASLKYTDTTPGGNFAINPPPQFTRYADIKAKGRFAGNQEQIGHVGMGRYYSEAIDDHSQLIHMRFGVPQFNSLTQFFTGFYNTGAGRLARTGRADTAFFNLGKAAGFIVSIISWKLLAVHLLGVGLRFALAKPSSKFYYLKPTMPLYWNAVTTMVNQLAVNRGIVPRMFSDSAADISGNPAGNEINNQQLHDLLPRLFKAKGGIDVYAMANRAQRLARIHYKKMEELLKNTGTLTNADLSALIQQANAAPLKDKGANFNDDSFGLSYMSRWLKGTAQSSPDAASETEKTLSTESAITETSAAGFGEFLEAELDDGGAFATFRVNSTGPVNESFSNSVGDSDIAGKINGMSSSSRSTSFSFAGGNVSDGFIGTAIKGIASAATDFASGVMESLSISGLAALGGAAFVDIPKHWQQSTASLPRANYTINLVSPYGNPISQLTNLYIPLCMLLAGALPISTGKQSYTSPFILELFDQGRCQTRLGMIDSLSVTRGTGNLGFSSDGHPMGIDITFSVIDLSSIMHMPISQGFELGIGSIVGGAVAGGIIAGPVGAGVGAAVAGPIMDAVNTVFSEDTVFSDYMAVISGMGLADQIYQWRKLKLNVTRAAANWDSFTSASHMASFAGDTLPGRLVSAFYKGVDRQ